ncbi:MAG TPA: acyl-CoA dehydrogenase family protein [Burkholderiaceae bacterium]|nr:acyl-CoA dehydrogenase family protein [Burkholderiaceae bacterium]HQR75786.1 acyl-CoA dehydrogenase family protein [Burkholderiaceae bacterium]
MSFGLTEEQVTFRDSVARFAASELKPGALARAHAGEYPRDVARRMASQGLLGITIAEADGGVGGTVMDAVVAIEAIASACPRSADVIHAGNFGAIRVLAEYGTPAQKDRYLRPLLSGEALISVGMTEPEAGSAVTELKSHATCDGRGWRINGSKVFTTHGPNADFMLAYCRFGPGVAGIGSVLIELNADGVRIGQRSKFMSGEEWAEIFFDDVYVDDEQVVLQAGGFKKQMKGFNVERLGNSARALSLGRYAYDEAKGWATQRKQFGRLLCEFQGLQWKFADMKVKLDGAQLLLYRAATGADRGFPSALDTAIAKIACNQAGFEVANEAMQVMGGLGYSQESLVEYCLRRCRGWMIAGGSIEMLKNRVAEEVFERKFPQGPTAGAG